MTSSELNPMASRVTRREFLRLLSAASAAVASGTAFAEETPARVPYAGKFRQLPPGAVRPEGWLRGFMTQQATELALHLPDASWPFTKPYWQGETEAESWWPWEQKAYWIDGATRLGLVLNDRALLQRSGAAITYTMESIGPDGYIGPDNFKNPIGDCHRWPQSIFFRSLEALAEASGEHRAGIADAMRKHYLNDRADYAKPLRNVVNVESMLWTFRETGDDRLLRLATDAWDEYLRTSASDPEHGDLSVLRVEADTPINCHGVTYAEISKLLPILYLYTGDRKYLDYGLATQRRVFAHHMLVDGIPSTTEWFRTVTALDSHETCCISDFTWNWGYYLMATGDGAWSDAMERACWNAGPGAVKKDWKALQYFSCPNQVVATLNSDHNVMEHGGHMMAFQPNPVQHTACCGGNVHRFLPNMVLRMWMLTVDHGLAATLYGPSLLETKVGREGRPVRVRQITDYPFGEKITLRFEQASAVEFPLLLRVPGWCTSPVLRVNGKAVALPEIRQGFLRLQRSFARNDEVELTLPMTAKLTTWPESGVAAEHGPLVYALPIQGAWSPVAVPRYTSAEYPAWDLTAEAPWNYGLCSEAAGIRAERKAVPADPWSNPPVSLKVAARRIPGWELLTNPANPAQKFTPALPDLHESTAAETVETLTLVPYGATHLRLTVFPDLRSRGPETRAGSEDAV